MPYADMTVEELEALKVKLQGEKDKAQADLREVVHTLEDKLAAKGAVDKFNSLSPAEKKAIAQVLGVSSIPSAEAVGVPK